jgi:hypothetical protein
LTKTLTYLAIIVALCTLGRSSARAQKLDDSDTRALIHANYLYQFATNCNWPAETKKGKFYIGVLGNSDVFNATKEKFGAKPVGNQTIEVVALTDIPTTQFFHIILIDKSKKAELAQANRDLKTKSTLILTNWEGALGSGAHINFKNVDNSVRYEMNENIIADRKITVGVKIVQWKV